MPTTVRFLSLAIKTPGAVHLSAKMKSLTSVLKVHTFELKGGTESAMIIVREKPRKDYS